MIKYEGYDIARKLLEMESVVQSSLPVINIRGLHSHFKQMRLRSGTLKVVQFWYAVPDEASFKAREMLVVPVKVVHTKEPYKINFSALDPDGREISFVWFMDGKGLPINEIPVEALEVE